MDIYHTIGTVKNEGNSYLMLYSFVTQQGLILSQIIFKFVLFTKGAHQFLLCIDLFRVDKL